MVGAHHVHVGATIEPRDGPVAVYSVHARGYFRDGAARCVGVNLQKLDCREGDGVNCLDRVHRGRLDGVVVAPGLGLTLQGL